MNLLYDRCLKEMREEFGAIFSDGYYKKQYDLQSRAGWINEIAKLTPEMIENTVSYPWSGAMFSDRLWLNKDALLFHAREIITQGLIQGKGLPEVSKALSAKMGQSYKVAERLIRTETNHLHNEADKVAYAAAGVEWYEFMAVLDARTSDLCAELDGKHFKLKDAKPGTNYPPMHPNCRSTTVEWDPDDALDWLNSGAPMPQRMTYEEWKKGRESEKYSEYEAMRDAGLLRMPYIDKFSNLKYSQSPAYQKLLERYKNLIDGSTWKAVEFNPDAIHDHFKRHGDSVGVSTAVEYQAKAIEFVSRKSGIAMVEDQCGVKRYYSESTNEFASVYPDGTISTYYKPRQGKQYWERQVEKYGEK